MRTGFKRQSGVSTIELLCTISIILILASMLLGPVLRAYHKARSFAGEMEGPEVVELAVNRLRRFHQAHPSHGFLTAAYLHRQAIFDSKFMQYVHQGRISYYPFSSVDADAKPVIEYSFSTNSGGWIYKSDITRAPGT